MAQRANYLCTFAGWMEKVKSSSNKWLKCEQKIVILTKPQVTTKATCQESVSNYKKCHIEAILMGLCDFIFGTFIDRDDWK